MVHETGHAYASKLNLIYKLEHIYGDTNLMINRPDSMFISKYRINSAYSKMNILEKSLIDNTFNKIKPVFNRFMIIR